jgi:hypothetical protein
MVLAELERIESERNFSIGSFLDNVMKSPYYLQKLLRIKPTKHDLIVQPVQYIASKLELEETSTIAFSFLSIADSGDNFFGWKTLKKSMYELFGLQIWAHVCFSCA